MTGLTIQVRGERLRLLADKAVYWPARRTLIIADLHLGKAMHFRLSGIAAPAAVEQRNLDRLDRLMQRWRPAEVLLLGDLFHSRHNASWESFAAFRALYADVVFTLISGNHDILDPERYHQAGITCAPFLLRGPFHFTHHPSPQAGHHNIAGHVHPGIRLAGKARQHLTLPCYWFGASAAVLPAFGTFTGLHMVRPVPGDRILAITGDHVFRCSTEA